MLYIIIQAGKNLNRLGPESAWGMVIRANSQEQAREIAQENEDQERDGYSNWTNPQDATVEPLLEDGAPGIVIIA